MGPPGSAAGPASTVRRRRVPRIPAAVSGRLVGRPGLTDAEGRPLCAAVRPPRIDWSADAAQ
ncbi:DUF5990 family protein [Streptomyces sp. NPDC085639]|uniref:DUF5990 family protein n=1 Tax=Streptomyces sp. NPDC085639 TaxID=3365734 RepID=UPI0037D548E2